MAQKIKITATDGSELVIEALGVLSQGDLDEERAALAQALAETQQVKSQYEQAIRNMSDISGLSQQIENAKQDILDKLPKEASDQDIDDIFDDSESVLEEA